MNYWLDPEYHKNGLELIADTMQHIINTGGIETVAIGSDFDGFTDPPDDIQDISEMGRLIRHLKTIGFSENEIDKICYTNVIRVLKEGWGKL
jgi:membrane dipeptidase